MTKSNIKKEELEKTFGIRRKITLRQYVLWLERDKGVKFIIKNTPSSHAVGSHYPCTEFKAKKILQYAKEMVKK